MKESRTDYPNNTKLYAEIFVPEIGNTAHTGTALHAYLRSSSCQLDTERSISYCRCKNAARRIHWRDYLKPSGNAMHSTLSIQFSKIIFIHHWAVTFSKRILRQTAIVPQMACLNAWFTYQCSSSIISSKLYTYDKHWQMPKVFSLCNFGMLTTKSFLWNRIVAPLSSPIDLHKIWNYIFWITEKDLW